MYIILQFPPQQRSAILIDIPLLPIVLLLPYDDAPLLGPAIDLKRKMPRMRYIIILVLLVHPLIYYNTW